MMRVWADRRLQVSLAATAIVLILGLGVGLSVWTSAQTASMLDQVREDLNRKDYGSYYREMAQYQIDAQVKIWTTIGQFVTAAALVIGGVIAWRNLRVGQENLRVAQENARVAQDNLRATQQKLDIDRESQITNRFTQAVGQLGAELKDGTPNLEVRLGGIYALERIARDSPRDHWTIMEVLTAYIRRNAPWPQPASMDAAGAAEAAERTAAQVAGPRTDIQAILTVLGRRDTLPGWPDEPDGLNLAGTNLQGADLRRAHLERVSFRRANLERADLTHARLEGADLTRACLARAILGEACLRGAHLFKADLQRAWCSRAGFEQADLRQANLEGTSFWEANLEGARFRKARLLNTVFREARLRGAELYHTYHLTSEQVSTAHEGGDGAILERNDIVFHMAAAGVADSAGGQDATQVGAGDGVNGSSSGP